MVSVAEHPYVATRVRAMKSKLIPRNEYAKLIKMELKGITKYLEQTEYKREIDELAVGLRGMSLVEHALTLNLGRAFEKIMSMSSEGIRHFVKAYFRRWDIWNIKSVIRGRFANATDEEILSFIVPTRNINYELLVKQTEGKSMDEIVETLKHTMYYQPLRKALKEYENTKTLAPFDNEMHIFYYALLAQVASEIPEEGIIFREFMRAEIDVLNLKTIIRLKREKIDSNRIKSFMIDSHSITLSAKKVDMLLAASNLDEVLRELENTKFWPFISAGVDALKKENTLREIELGLDRYLLKNAHRLIYQQPLSISPIMAYIVSKEAEIKNITLIVRAKESGLSEEFMEKNINVL